jgi:hypothetical protein
MEATVEKVRKINGTDFISSKAHVCIVGEKWDKRDKKPLYKKGVSIFVCITDQQMTRSNMFDPSLSILN